MRFTYTIEDDRIIHDDAHDPFSDKQRASLYETFETSRAPEAKPEITGDIDWPGDFTPKLVQPWVGDLMLVDPDWAMDRSFTLPEPCKAGWLSTSRGRFAVFDLRPLAQAFERALIFEGTEFIVVKQFSLETGKGVRVLDTCRDARNMARLHDLRPGSQPLRPWVPVRPALRSAWPWSILSFDGCLWISDMIDLTDSGRVRTHAEIILQDPA